jgi:hypothetical protein
MPDLPGRLIDRNHASIDNGPMWFARAVVLTFVAGVAAAGLGLVGAGRTERKRNTEFGSRSLGGGTSTLETVGWGLFFIGFFGALVDLAG